MTCLQARADANDAHFDVARHPPGTSLSESRREVKVASLTRAFCVRSLLAELDSKASKCNQCGRAIATPAATAAHREVRINVVHAHMADGV